MSSLESYVMRIKPAIDTFIKDPSKETLHRVEGEIIGFDFGQMRIFQVQILTPLVIKLDDLKGGNQELRTNLVDCIRNIISKLYISHEKGLLAILVAMLQQVRDPGSANMRTNLSEEMKLATVLCISEALRRSTTDVLEAFYSKGTATLIGEILMYLIELIKQEKYRKLVIAALECLMIVFYVHDECDGADIVLRNQVADSTFLFLPKVIIVLFKTAIADDKVGEAIKSGAVKALGLVICIMFEETSDDSFKNRYDADAFQTLLSASKHIKEEQRVENNIFGSSKPSVADMEQRMNQLLGELRSSQWMAATAQRLQVVFRDISVLRAHETVAVRREYSEMCCLLLKKCALNLDNNFIYLLESVLALSEDTDTNISQACQAALVALQELPACGCIFDENAELLLDKHMTKWPSILQHCEDNEQFAEFLFFKGFLRNVRANKLQEILLVSKNLELFVACLLASLDMRTNRELLDVEYSLRNVQQEDSRQKLPWRQFKQLSAPRCVNAIYEIAKILGDCPLVSDLICQYCLELIEKQSPAMNEAILLLTLMITTSSQDENRITIAKQILEELLNDVHWQLALQPDAPWRLKVNKRRSFFEKRTPGLYESAVEVRTQDYESDEESELVAKQRVSLLDAQFNVLHTCLVLDAVGHCALQLGDQFNRYLFRSLHKVLLKLASSNSIIHGAAGFAFKCMQLALKYEEPIDFIEHSTDYISSHLNKLLKRSPESNDAVEILSVVLQYSTRGNLPHLDSTFKTILEECSKSYQTQNIHSYLRVFDAFLRHVSNWQNANASEIHDLCDQTSESCPEDILSIWMTVLKKPVIDTESITMNTETPMDVAESDVDDDDDNLPAPQDIELPNHIALSKTILRQVIHFVSSTESSQQIIALECLISGLPLLANYEDDLLPLVHSIWEPLMEKFRQKNPIVLQRCFVLLQLIGIHAKLFVLKRSLSDVIPQLQWFLRTASERSALEYSPVQTQEYKLQLLLLRSLPNFIQCVQLQGKHLHALLDTVMLYLAETQSEEFQTLAKEFFQLLVPYNGPFVYCTLLQRAHLKPFKVNVAAVLQTMGFES